MGVLGKATGGINRGGASAGGKRRGAPAQPGSAATRHSALHLHHAGPAESTLATYQHRPRALKPLARGSFEMIASNFNLATSHRPTGARQPRRRFFPVVPVGTPSAPELCMPDG